MAASRGVVFGRAQKEGAYSTYPEERWRWEVKVEAEGVAKGGKGGRAAHQTPSCYKRYSQ